MSADACVVFYGLRYEITLEESEDSHDARIRAARKVGLKYYSANFGGLCERYLLFIGTSLGILGPENKLEVQLGPEPLREMMDLTNERLLRAGLSGKPALYIQWEEDI
jgi:hypothetical protein